MATVRSRLNSTLFVSSEILWQKQYRKRQIGNGRTVLNIHWRQHIVANVTNYHKLSIKQLKLTVLLGYGSEVQHGSHWAETEVPAGLCFVLFFFFSWKLQGRIHFFFQLLEVVLVLWVWATSSTLKASKGRWSPHMVNLELLSHLSWFSSLHLPSSTFKDPPDYTGPTQIVSIIALLPAKLLATVTCLCHAT